MSSKHPYVIGNINPGLILWETAVAFMDARSHGVAVIGKVAGPYLDVQRNDVINTYFNDPDFNDTPWFIFMDTDVPMTLDAMDELINVPDDVRIVSGIYANVQKRYGVRDIIYSKVPVDPDDEEYAYRHWRYEPYEHKHLLDLDGHPAAPHLKPVDAVGAGALAIHRSVISEMRDFYGSPMPWFYCTIVAANSSDAPQWVGEDFGFCLRAQHLGHTIYANTNVLLSHIKQFKFHPGLDVIPEEQY